MNCQEDEITSPGSGSFETGGFPAQKNRKNQKKAEGHGLLLLKNYSLTEY